MQEFAHSKKGDYRISNLSYNSRRMARLLLADDHQLVREGFRALLQMHGFEVVGEAADGFAAVRLARECQPDVAIVDLSMPLLNGIEAAREIANVSPRTRTILLTIYTEDHYVMEALRAGASGYLLKSRAAKDLVDAIRKVEAGGIYLGAEVSDAAIRTYQKQIQISTVNLSSRERQVLALIAQGKSTREVAVVLGISPKTASAHRANLMKKLDVHETAGLVRYAIRTGMVAA
jgi:two-component system, NarL family, response regulator NreC